MSLLQTFPKIVNLIVENRALKTSKLLTSALFWSALKNVLYYRQNCGKNQNGRDFGSNSFLF
jgi:hypothetical protein